MYASGPAAYDYVLCDTAAEQSQQFLRRAFVGTRSEFSHRHHWAGVVDGQVIACGGLRFASQNLGFALAAAGLFLRHYGPLGGGRTVVRGVRTERVIEPPSGDVGILYNLGVDPAWRGQGVGRQLIGFLLRQLEERGCPRAGLDVAETNTGARRLYDRLGFRAVTTRDGGPTSRFGRVVSHTYMERGL